HYAWTRDRLVIVSLVDVASRVEIVTPSRPSGDDPLRPAPPRLRSSRASGDDPLRPAPPRLRSSRASWRREPVAGIPAATNTVVVSADDTGDELFLDSSG
ncbi:S9 family peptidase, partial [Mycobacterium tuberculosis]|nr:S9 family peptidase [Mycobacterium tuberculosis]